MRTSIQWSKWILVGSCVLLFAVPGAGQQFEVFVGDGPQRAPVVTFNSAREEFLVVWQEEPTGLFARWARLRSGEVRTGPIRQFAGLNADDPSVEYNSVRGTYLAIWKDVETRQVWATRLRRNGAVFGEPVLIDSDPCRFADEFDIAYDKIKDRWLAVWEAETAGGCSGPPERVVGRIVRGNGSLGGPVFTIWEGSGPDGPSVAYNPAARRYLAVWKDESVPGLFTVLAQRIRPDGALAGPTLTIAESTEEQGGPSVTFVPGKRWMVAWVDEGLAPPRVVGRFVRPDGTLLHSFLIDDGSALAAAVTDQAFNRGSCKNLVVWAQVTDLGLLDAAIYGQWIRRDGTFVGGNFPVSPEPGLQLPPEAHNYVACSSARRTCVAVWENDWDENGDIYGAFVTAPGH